MRVLDIDLDFFLSAPCPFAAEGSRPDDRCAVPWTEEQTRTFLERNLGLSPAHPVPGKIFDTHDGSVLVWKKLICAGRLSVPFTVTHVDTHTDLGIAQKGYPFVKHLVLARSAENRSDFDSFRADGQLNEANYLVFALAARMICRLENLRNPLSRPDLPPEMLTDKNHIQLRSAFPELFEAKNGPEPIIEYAQYDDPLSYRAESPFGFITLARSPRYTPRSADYLESVIADYIRPI